MFLLEPTSVGPPAQGSVLPQHSAHGGPVVAQGDGALRAEPLPVVPQEGAVADLCS